MLVLFLTIWSQLKILLSSYVHLVKLRCKYPKSRFYPGVFVDELSYVGRYDVLFMNTKVNNSTINDHTFIQKNTSVNHAVIGKFCSIAGGVTIGLGQHPTDRVSSYPAFYSKTQPIAKTFSVHDSFSPLKKTEIGHDVWIGQGAMIKDGVRIGTGAVIAAGAVVVEDVAEYAIVGGVPARVIKYRFCEDMRKKLLATRWWDMSDEWMHAHVALFSEPSKLVAYFKNTRQHKEEDVSV